MKGIILLFSLALLQQAQGQTIKPQTYNFTKQEGIDLVNSLFKACNPDLPENAYMPALLRQKLRWVYVEKLSRRLDTRIAFNENSEWGNVTMFASYSDIGTPYITVVVDYVLLSVRVDSGVKTGFGRMNKNSFCLGLAHEAIHLENPKSFFERAKTRAVRIQEEFRTYKKLESVAVEFGHKKEPLENEDVEIYKIIGRCPGPKACKAFVDHFSKRANDIPDFPKR